jgi:Family of unknown function (DUF5937)
VVIEIEFTPEDYRRIRFAFSPVGEAVKSLRVLSAGRRNGLHARWLAWLAGTDVDRRVDLNLLTAVVRPQGYLPDFLGPLPPGRTVGFAEGLSQIAATPAAVVQEELGHLARHAVAQQGSRGVERAAVMRELLEDPEDALSLIVTELERYWEYAIEPHWPRIHSLLQADLAYRLEELATAGVGGLFRSLHPSVAFRGELLTVVKYYRGRVALRGRGLLLVPCAFAWPDVLISTADPLPSLTYGPRGLGTLWETGDRSGAEAPLSAVVGNHLGVPGPTHDDHPTRLPTRRPPAHGQRPPQGAHRRRDPHRTTRRTPGVLPAHPSRGPARRGSEHIARKLQAPSCHP